MKKSELRNIIKEEIQDILLELNYRDLRGRAPEYLNTREKSRETKGTQYQNIKGDTITFKTKSDTGVGTYTEKVKLLDLRKFLRSENTTKDAVKKALLGDIQVSCSCPAWKFWGYQYIGTKEKYAIEPERRSPKIRNPQLKGSICKHLDVVLYVLPFLHSRITKELRQMRYWNTP